MKLGSIFKNGIAITQSPHGSWQEGNAMDLVNHGSDKELKAPFSGTITKTYNLGGDNRGFWLEGDCDGTYIEQLFHHCQNYYPYGAKLEKGQIMGTYNIPNYLAKHVHTAIKVNGKYDIYLNYVSRTNKLYNGYPEGSQGYKEIEKWTKWSKYSNKNINCKNDNMVDKLKVQVRKNKYIKFPIKVIADELILRSRPRSNSKNLGMIKKGDKFNPNKFVLDGEEIDGNSTWFYLDTKKGWISARWVDSEFSKKPNFIKKAKSLIFKKA